MSDTSNINYDDPLAIPAGSLAEPEFPVLSEGVKRMTIRDFQVKEKDGKKRLEIKLATTTIDQATDGKTLHPGFSFNHALFMTPNENSTKKEVAEQLGMPLKAALGKSTQTTWADCLANPPLLKDKLVDVKIGVRQGKGEYEGVYSNTVKAWIIPPA